MLVALTVILRGRSQSVEVDPTSACPAIVWRGRTSTDILLRSPVSLL
jgi:hypothetical protein